MTIVDPTLAQIVDLFVNATPYGTIVIFVVLLVTDFITPSRLRKAAEKRADDAIAAVSTLTLKLEAQASATAALTAEHKEEREEWQRELAGLARELAALSGRPGRR